MDVVVVLKFIRRNAVPGKGHHTAHRRHRGKTQRGVVFAHRERDRFPVGAHLHPVVPTQLGPGGDHQWLQIGPVRSRRFQPQGFELLGDIRRRAFQTLGAGPAAFPFRRGQKAHVLAVSLRVCLFGRNRREEKGSTEDQALD